MHGQWDWMRDPKIHSTTWEWDNASPGRAVEALAQRAAPHLHQRDRQGQRPRLRHHARRRGPALAPVYLGAAAVELRQRLLLRVRHRGVRPRARQEPRARSDARTRSSRREAKAVLAQDPQAGDQGLRRPPAAVRPVVRCTTLAANFTANLVRNLWTHSVIMCGHFPEGVETFEKTLDRGRDPRRVVPAPDARLGQHLRLARRMHFMTGNLSLPDRAPPVPRPAEQPLRRDRPAGAGPLRALRPDLRHRLAAPAGRLGVAQGRPALAAQRLPGRRAKASVTDLAASKPAREHLAA